MNRTEVEQRAERELGRVPKWIWSGKTLPVPVEHIADSVFGLHVRNVDDLRTAPGVPDVPGTQGLSGLLLPAIGEIWVNAGEARVWPSRRRFTISHELGHWCLHRAERAIWCRSHVIDPSDDQAAADAARAPNEREADEFAAALLMPAALVRRHYERLRRSDPEGCFQQLCELFGVSGAAMGRRLQRVV